MVERYSFEIHVRHPNKAKIPRAYPTLCGLWRREWYLTETQPESKRDFEMVIEAPTCDGCTLMLLDPDIQQSIILQKALEASRSPAKAEEVPDEVR